VDDTDLTIARAVRDGREAYEGMSTNQPLTLTVEQAAEVLGVGRSTAYELVRSGDLKCIRLRRRIVVPVAHLAESLGVDRDAVWEALTSDSDARPGPSGSSPSKSSPTRRRERTKVEEPALFWRSSQTAHRQEVERDGPTGAPGRGTCQSVRAGSVVVAIGCSVECAA